MIADRRLWWTADRASLVEEGDLRAAFLAYTPGKRVRPEDESSVRAVGSPPKAVHHPADKAVRRPRDK
jgi:hypothetical protein